MLKLWSVPLLALALGSGISSGHNSGPQSPTSDSASAAKPLSYEATPAISELRGDTSPPTRSWIAKLARKMRNGAGLSWEDDVDTLMKMSRSEIVDHFLKDPRFFDTVLDFNLYFLGFKPAEVTVPQSQRYAAAAYNFPQAISAAKAVANSGDYFTLFDLQQPSYLPPFGEPVIPQFLAEQAQNLARPERRALLVGSMMNYIDQLVATFGAGASFDKDKGCAFFISNETFTRFFPSVNGLSGGAADLGVNQLFSQLFSACTVSKLGESFISAAIDKFRARALAVSGAIELFDDSRYQISTISDLKSLDGEMKGELHLDFWGIKTNSSTNYNRKRAATILKTYFCDDLTPINIVAPDVHGNDQHGSDPSCQACHYKLDPMAGFFRDQGLLGVRFPAKDTMVFDDGAMVSGSTYDAYMDSWKVAGDWNVGYIRSLRDPSLNSYERDHEQPLDELFRVIREAPEVKACLVKRMSEFFISQEQVFDGAFLAELTQTLSKPAQASGDNFKEVVRRLMLSQTFAEPNPNARICYDPPGAEAQGARCEVSFIMKTRCAACHADFALDDPAVQAKILDRLQSSDPDRRMPLRMDMPDTERVALIKWLTQGSQP